MSTPYLEFVDGSEIVAEVDTSAISLDGLYRPVVVSADGGDSEIAMTVDDARRLLEFLKDAIVYLENPELANLRREQ